jgi:pyruvate carboxylase subunit B
VLVNHVPGGMISNLSNQLKESGALNRMNEVLSEIPRVREDLGFPPLVTPTSQIVGTQAVLNILTGSRYKSITNEVKNYLLGHYGKAPGQVNEQVKKRAVGDAEVITRRPADLLEPEMSKLRMECENLAKGEEDVLTFAMFPDLAKTFLQERNANTLKPDPLLSKEAATTQSERYAPNEFKVTLHGETFHIKLTGSGQHGEAHRPFYVSVDGISEEVVVETLNEIEVSSGKSGSKKKQAAKTDSPARPRPNHQGCVVTAMPGTIVKVKVEVGDRVEAGDGILVIEAMKMENEIQAPMNGIVISVHVKKGDSVAPDETLVEIQTD